VTIDGLGNGTNPQAKPDLVKTCDPASAKGSVAMLEEDCSAGERFNVDLKITGPLKLKVLETASGDLNFWCIEHQQIMTPIIRITP
jgi:hypothetical protein